MNVDDGPSSERQKLWRITDTVVGRQREIELILAAVNTGRDLLLEGPPGTSKTTLLKAITDVWGVPLVFAEGNAELTPGRLLGHHDPARVLAEGYSRDSFEAGPLVEAMQTGGFLYFEEFNRAPEDTLNTLLTAIADRRVSIPRFGTVNALPSFRLIGSMNPYDTVGTTRLSVSIKDRLNRLVVTYQTAEDEQQIVGRRSGAAGDNPADQRQTADAVAVTRATRSHEAISQGASVRGAIDLAVMVRELCRVREIGDLQGDEYRLAFWEAMQLALSGRITLDHAAERDEVSVLREIWEERFRGLGYVEECGQGPIIGEEVRPAPDEPRDIADHADRGFRIAPKALGAQPDLRTGANGAGLASVTGRQTPNSGNRLPGSSMTTSEIGELDDEEGESAGSIRAAQARALEIAKRFQLRDLDPQVRPRRGGLKITSVPYSGAADDIDLDRTIEATNRAEGIESTDIFVRERRRTGRQVILAVDISSSMRGERLLSAAATVGALFARLHRDDLGVIAFWSDAAMLTRLGERPALDRVVDEMLALDGQGLTNVSFPLELAANEFHGPGYPEQRMLLLSDCVHNAGPDPRVSAGRLPRVDVLFDVGGERDSELARQIAGSGRGEVLPVRNYFDIPDALSRIFGSSV